MTGDDKTFFNIQVKKLNDAGLSKDFSLFGDFRPESLGQFFKSLSVLSVPVLKGEAFGLYQLESLASGVPLVQPALGAFPEIIGETGGGLLYEPNTPEALAECLSSVLNDRARMQQLSVSGRKAVEEKFDFGMLAVKMMEVYKNII